ncbi:hypothetical protein Btru_072841 [Bulinus truncatus]|nr:hypothetical protein Btru_072841 [Bulinus truncatus]
MLKYLGSVSSFPLKSCSFDDTEILFVLDCRHEVKEQIDFINKSVEYLRFNKNWKKLSVFYVTDKERNPMTIEVLTSNVSEKANNISNQCNSTMSLDDLFHITKQNNSQKYATLRINIIFSNINYTNKYIFPEIAKRQKKQDKNYRFFILSNNYSTIDKIILQDTNFFKLKNKVSGIHFHYADSFKKLDILSLFPKICDLTFFYTNLTFVAQNFQRSFYHVDYKIRFTYGNGIDFCGSSFNSYLISLETYGELNYLISDVLNSIQSSWKISKPIYIPLGLVIKPHEPIFWSSGNPFTYDHKQVYHNSTKCAYFNYTANVNDTFLLNNTNDIWKYLHLMDCDLNLHETYIVCESHLQLKLDEEFSINPLNKPDTSGLVPLIDIMIFLNKIFHDRDELQKVNCSNYSDAPYDENYFCTATQTASSVHTYVRLTFLGKSGDHNGTFHCNDYFTTQSRNKVNQKVKRCESNCYYNSVNPLVDLCPTNKVKMPKGIESMYCKNNEEPTLRCLHLDSTNCRDNSHLVNCENFQCPDGFIKCPHSYCIPIITVDDADHQCPLGQEKAIFTHTKAICFAMITIKFKDICLHSSFILEYSHNNSICKSKSCPKGYVCVSTSGQEKENTILKVNLLLYNISNSLFPHGRSEFYLPYIQIIGIQAPGCKVQNVNKAFENWNITETVVLDLSNNEIIDSVFKFLSSMTYLRFLNLSRNFKLSVNVEFVFPLSLEIIDLSHTSIESLPNNCFNKLQNLSLLDLSYTRIYTFGSTGIPESFTLDTLNIRGVKMTNIKYHFYKGLTVKGSLLTSDVKLCCPQILGLGISPDKCKAPGDVTSSCKHIVVDKLKKISIWVVCLLAISGNVIVLIYTAVWGREKIFQTAYGLFVTGLAVSDLLMGVYLMIIAAVDLVYSDDYVVFDDSWRNSFLCQFSGFLSTLSSETSTFLIRLITLDRFIITKFTLIAHALGQVAICVNVIQKRNLPSLRHCSVRRLQEISIAKKLALVALTDFLCWFPIGIMGILSINGEEFDREVYAWMAVFVLPVNSAVNPMIYTIPVIIDKLKIFAQVQRSEYILQTKSGTMLRRSAESGKILSLSECATKCHNNYTNCSAFSYDRLTLTCFLGQCLVYQPITSLTIYQKQQPICDSTAGFTVEKNGLTYACLWWSSEKKNFTEAKLDCQEACLLGSSVLGTVQDDIPDLPVIG